mmetsp:Transcript_35248/g.93403  ORF Transcript_35248/g.93403 Transcript_35248/m.93403 type:complete len:306 (+) Transcript_35248:363-1280(+)
MVRRWYLRTSPASSALLQPKVYMSDSTYSVSATSRPKTTRAERASGRPNSQHISSSAPAAMLAPRVRALVGMAGRTTRSSTVVWATSASAPGSPSSTISPEPDASGTGAIVAGWGAEGSWRRMSTAVERRGRRLRRRHKLVQPMQPSRRLARMQYAREVTNGGTSINVCMVLAMAYSLYTLMKASTFKFIAAYHAMMKKAEVKKVMSRWERWKPWRAFSCVRSYHSVQCLPASSVKNATMQRRSWTKCLARNWYGLKTKGANSHEPIMRPKETKMPLSEPSSEPALETPPANRTKITPQRSLAPS